MPTISIIVPIYNAEKYLRRCIDSILSQSFTDYEIVLIDDGSNDNSFAVCNEYATIDTRFKVIHKENGGVSSARERGLQECSGEYVIHVDPDDWVESDMMQKLHERAKDTDADMVICDILEEYPWGELYRDEEPIGLRSEQVLDGLFRGKHGSCCNKLVRTEFIRRNSVHFPEGLNFCEDLVFNASLLMAGPNVSYVPKAFYHYDHKTNSNSIVKNTNNPVERTKEVIKRLEPIVGENYPGLLQMKITAKQQCIPSHYSYNYYARVYPEIGNYSRIRYYAQSLISRLKDIYFTIRHRG